MGKFHVNGDGKVSMCRAKNKPCPLGEESHFSNREEAEQMSQELLEKKFGLAGEKKYSRMQEPSFKQIEKYNGNIYDFDKSKLAESSLSGLNSTRQELFETYVELDSKNLATKDDLSAIRENISSVDKEIKKKERIAKAKKLLEEKEREKRELDDKIRRREAEREQRLNYDRFSGCGGSSSGCGC